MYHQKRNFTTQAYGRPAQCARKGDWRDENEGADYRKIKSGKCDRKGLGKSRDVQESVRYYQSH
jgi:hypothetical protein